MGISQNPAVPAVINRGIEIHGNASSSMSGDGLDELWETIREFEKITRSSDYFGRRRHAQNIEWGHSLVQGYMNRFFSILKESGHISCFLRI